MRPSPGGTKSGRRSTTSLQWATVVSSYAPMRSRTSSLQNSKIFWHSTSWPLLHSRAAKSRSTSPRRQITKHVANAQFVKDSGGHYLQILDKLTSYTRSVTPDECKRLGKLLAELGKRTADIGIPLGYHNHLNTLSQKPENLDLILENSDPKYLQLELDTAHAVAGGGDPVQMIRKYHDRLLFMHLKDVHDIPADTPKARYPFEFVELGRGRVDLPGVFAALDKVAFSGWTVVELDRVPDKSRTPKESAVISKDYLDQKIGVKV
ncbi:MAG: Xylose isomerase domain protein barrel [Edaphobacter sp.]|nr:Xylose isomerase domain protein barrel [Edaphobacter sp.]